VILQLLHEIEGEGGHHRDQFDRPRGGQLVDTEQVHKEVRKIEVMRHDPVNTSWPRGRCSANIGKLVCALADQLGATGSDQGGDFQPGSVRLSCIDSSPLKSVRNSRISSE
jgi:hypothetical protein